MDWFEQITGFKEGDHASTQARLRLDGAELVGERGQRHAVGQLSLCRLADLRHQAHALGERGASRVSGLSGDVRQLHALPEQDGALIQVASQFNLLEMVGPRVSPEDGVTRYASDRTQGPACAIAAGAATIYRNYLVPLDGQRGQTATRQINTLAPLGEALAQALGCAPEALWTLRNGYALCSANGLARITDLLQAASMDTLDRWRGCLQIGLHRAVAVTDLPAGSPHRVSQAFCSALPVAYSGLPARAWAPFARLVLEAAYEATLLAAALAQADGGTGRVLLTRLGGGAFGNADAWIDDALARALTRTERAGLDVVLVSHGAIPSAHHALAARWPG